MSAKITSVYDALVDLIEAQLSADYKRLPNPYALDENSFLLMRKGFGVAIGAGRDTERYTGCLVTWERLFTIILVNQITTTQNNLTARETIEKSILTDHDTLRKQFYMSTLGGTVIKATVVSDAGISFIDADKQQFLGLEIDLVVEYQENPND